MAPSVEFRNVSKVYRLGNSNTSLRELVSGAVTRVLRRSAAPADSRSFHALKDVSFQVGKGEALGLIGPNGAGKSTALKILANITQPTSGEVVVNGRIASLIELGAGFHIDLTGRENIYLNAAILGIPRARINARFDDIIAFSGLDKFIDTPIKRYSSGMQVRLGFSVAAHLEPDILVVDEVLAVGDSQFRQRCTERIAELKGEGTTIIFVSHNLFLVKNICDNGILMGNGKIQAQGDIVEVINAYETWIHERGVQRRLTGSKDLEGSFAQSAVQITRVEAVQPDPEDEDEVFRYDEPCEIRVHFEANEVIPDPNLVIHIARADGAIACMVRSRDYGYHFDAISGSGWLSIHLEPLQLTGGGYNIEAQILNQMDVQLARGTSSWFMVSGLGLSSRERGGVFVPQVRRIEVQTAREPA